MCLLAPIAISLHCQLLLLLLLLLILIIMYTNNKIHRMMYTRNNKGNQKYCQSVMTNEGPALDSRALAQDLTEVRLSLP